MTVVLRYGTRIGTMLSLAVILCAAPATGQGKFTASQDRFQLFSQVLGALTVNRVYCGLDNSGDVCVDSTGSSTIGGGFWPKDTRNQYFFNSGLQMAGIIGPDGGPWAGDTTGAFFFDLKGTTRHGGGLTPIFNSTDPVDRAEWPDEARIPAGPLYQAESFGQIAVSDDDVWWLMWEGDPAKNAGRPHPMGILVETRGMGWNYPGGNADAIYFIHTLYNITSLNEADYLAVTPAMRSVLIQQAQQFHVLNSTAFGITLPAGGYTITELYAGYGSDPDVADAGTNFATVNLPMATGFSYDRSFGTFPGWTFDPALHTAPFFAGSGLGATKFLQGLDGSPRLQMYSNYSGGGTFPAAQNTTQLYRHLSGNILTAAGDGFCNNGDPKVTRVCYLNNSRPFDMRYYQSAQGTTLAPGEFRSLVTAYIFAAPVTDPACQAPCDIFPGDPTIHGDPARMAGGVNSVDRIAGYAGFNDVNGDGVVSQYEYRTVPRSLYGKAQLAQAFFDNQFLAPTAPEAPEFFLIPGDDQVTVMWRPSSSEQTGDPFFDVAKDANSAPPGGGPAVPNPLYDPNFRQFDVEGYRIYRGRVDDPAALEEIASFFYPGTTFKDFAGQVNPDRLCAPELGIRQSCPVAFDSIGPGIPRTVFVEHPFGPWQPIIQVRFGDRIALPDGSAQMLRADSVSAGDRVVPFLLVDQDVRNSFRYFYTVTAYDVNSWQSGPGSLESVRIVKPVTPERRASNLTETVVTVTTRLLGRGVVLDTAAPLPTIDPVSGIFSGPMPPANGWGFQLSDMADQVLLGRQRGSARLDSVRLGNAWGSPAWGSPERNTYWFTVEAGSNRVTFPLATFQPFLDDPGETFSSGEFPAIPIDPGLGDRFGGSGDFAVPGQLSITQPGIYLTNGTGRSSSLAFGDGAAHEDLWDGSFYDGPRWFSGVNESFANPTGGFCAPNCTVTNWNNAGHLPGIISIHQPASYTTMNFSFREFQGAMGGASRAADVELHWGAGGVVDSVIDVTHNVPVPFRSGNATNALGVRTDIGVGASWGFLNMAGQAGGGEFNSDPSNVSAWDFVCLNPFWVDTRIRAPCSLDPDAGDAPMFLEPRAVLSTLGYVTTSFIQLGGAPARLAQGLALYINGNIFFFETNALPAPGTVWTLRDYVGGVYGGKGTDAAGTIINDAGDYGFLPAVRPLTAVGTVIEFEYDAVQGLNAVTTADLDAVHPVPDPFYFQSGYDDPEVIRFVNLPQQAIIRIYTASGVLVALVEHNSSTLGGEAEWDVRNRDGTRVAAGVYFYHLESNEARRVGRMVVVNARR